MKLVSLVLLAAPIAVFVGTGILIALPFGVTSMGNPGPPWAVELLYASTSCIARQWQRLRRVHRKVAEPGQTADCDQQWTTQRGCGLGPSQRKDSVKVFTCSVKEASRTVARPLEWV
jgi:hypothetical protein